MKNNRGTRLVVLTSLVGIALSLAACGGSPANTQAPPGLDESAWSATTEPAPEATVEPPQPKYDMLTVVFIDSYRDQYPDRYATDDEILARGEAVCADFTAALDAGESFSTYVIARGQAEADPTEFGYVLGGAMVALCPEVTQHPNYSGQ